VDRKNAEEIPPWSMSSDRSCKTSLAPLLWDHRPLVTVLVEQVVEQLGEPDGNIAFDPSSFPNEAPIRWG